MILELSDDAQEYGLQARHAFESAGGDQLVARAEEYLRLRDESWSLRSEALHKGKMITLRQADRVERASLDALEKIRPVDHN